MSDDEGVLDPAPYRHGNESRARDAIAVVAFVGGFVFLLFAAGIGITRFVDRVENDYAEERLEVARWDCLESFIRSTASDVDRVRLVIEPVDDTYVRQRVVETVYPAVDLTLSDDAPVLRIVVRPGDDPDATCRGLLLSIER
jgi:hypothetical protein